MQNDNASKNEREREFFDRVAEQHLLGGIQPMSQKILERYKWTKNANYFMKEKMFQLVNQNPGKKILEVGCGEGTSSVQLAYAGKEVTAYDLSPKSIEVAQLTAEANKVKVNFMVGDASKIDIVGREEYDIVWFQLVLHHLVPELDQVMKTAYETLRPGGLFVACEPIAYHSSLKKFSRFAPGSQNFTPDECPLRPSEFEIIRRYFPKLHLRYYRLFARVDRFTKNLSLIKAAGWLDSIVLNIL